MSQQNSTNQPQQEVDLLVLANMFFKWLKSVCCSVWNAFVSSLIYLIRKSPWLALFVVIGASITWVSFKSKPKFYISSAIVSSNSMESSIVMDNLKTLDYLFDSERYDDLTTLLGLSVEDAMQIKSLTGYYGVVYKNYDRNSLPAYYVKQYNPRDTSLRISHNYFKVTAQVYNENIYPILSKALIDYIGSSNFGQQSNALREGQVKEQMVNTDREIAVLQQALASYSTTSKVANPMMSGENQKSELLQMQEVLAKLYARKNELERQNALFTASATIVADFSKSFCPANRNRFYAAAGAIIAFVLGLTGLLLWDNRKKIIAAIREKK